MAGTGNFVFKYQNFNETFAFNPEKSYDEIAIQRIDACRAKLEGLFIEMVMKDLKVKRRRVPYQTRRQ